MLTPVTFQVFGDPSTQGGTKTVPTRTADGRTVYRKITEGGVNLKSWRQEVSTAAHEQYELLGQQFDGPVRLTVQFRFSMPASRPMWAKQQGLLLRSGKPDLDKLERAIGDSLKTGGLLKDDALIAAKVSSKIEVWDGWIGAQIRVEALDQRAFFAPKAKP